MSTNKLAEALAGIATHSKASTAKADAVLAIIRDAGLTTGQAFNEAVREAYTANGWKATAGKPAEGATKLDPVPNTVKQYISQIRLAFKMRLRVPTYKTVHALRKAIRDAKAESEGPGDKHLAGLKLAGSGALTGAAMHDLAALYTRLPRARKSELVAKVNRLVMQYKAYALEVIEQQKAA